MNLPELQRFDASGLLPLPTGELLTINDRSPRLYRVRPQLGGKTADLDLVPDWFTAAQLAPLTAQKNAPYDCEGMAQDEGVRLIEELRDHATQDRFVYYHAWRVGDVVMWDEIATMHRGAGDSRPEERRIMLRTIVHPN